ncbi:MAG: hypothetical protein HOV80_18945 [Polyangiaceae bacterium]|nr:hypothetical protein [Polyangiaceae bacterium]
MSSRSATAVKDPCPRCGGAPAAPRAPTAANPFLPKEKRPTCSLCGLVYERGAAAWRPGTNDGVAAMSPSASTDDESDR